MTAPETRWTAETEDRLAEEFDQFVGHRFLVEDRDRCAALALAFLATAGLLLTPDFEPKTEVRNVVPEGEVLSHHRLHEVRQARLSYVGQWIEVPS